MRETRITVAAVLALFLVGSAAAQSTPSSDERQGLAPTGALRVALLDANAVHVIRAPNSAERKGVSHDLGEELARRLGVPFEPQIHPTIAGLLDAGRTGQWDVAFVGVSPERRAYLAFTANHLEVEYGYLVPSGSKISDIGQVDRSGVRLAVLEKSSPEAFLTGALKSATLVRTPAIPGALELLSAGKADALAGLKPNMYAVAARLPGSRVLDGAPGAEAAALAMPKDRHAAALAYAQRFLEHAKKTGLVQQAIDRAGLRGVVVAPLSPG